MKASWKHHESVMKASWKCHESVMKASWKHHESVMKSSWKCNESIMKWKQLKTLEDAWRCLRCLKTLEDTWWCLIMHDDISIIHGINKHHTWNEQASCYQQASRVVFGKSWNLKVLSLEGTMWLALNHCMELRANHMVPSRLKTYSLILISEH